MIKRLLIYNDFIKYLITNVRLKYFLLQSYFSDLSTLDLI